MSTRMKWVTCLVIAAVLFWFVFFAFLIQRDAGARGALMETHVYEIQLTVVAEMTAPGD